MQMQKQLSLEQVVTCGLEKNTAATVLPQINQWLSSLSACECWQQLTQHILTPTHPFALHQLLYRVTQQKSSSGVLCRHSPSDFTWALLMAAARPVVEADRFTRAGQWQTWEPDLLLGSAITGATLGILGLGRIGQAVARRAKGFELQILYANQYRCDPELEQSLGVEFVTFDRLLQESDFVTIHTPLTEDTFHLFGDRQFEQMKRSAILINTARGLIVDPNALYRALTSHQIAAAALDVTDPEPIPTHSPLLTLDNLIITPHIGSATRPTREKMARMAIANLVAGLNGDCLPHCVNPEVYQ